MSNNTSETRPRLPAHNIQFDLLAANILVRILSEVISSKVYLQLNIPELESTVAREFFEELGRKHITLTEEEARQKMESVLRLAHHIEEHRILDSDVKESLSTIDKKQKAVFKDLVKHDNILRVALFDADRSRSPDMTSITKRRRMDAPSLPTRPLSRLISQSSENSELAPDRFVDLLPDGEANVTTSPVDSKDIVRYLFEVVEVQKEEARSLRAVVENQTRQIQRLLDGMEKQSKRLELVVDAQSRITDSLVAKGSTATSGEGAVLLTSNSASGPGFRPRQESKDLAPSIEAESSSRAGKSGIEEFASFLNSFGL